MHIQQLRLTTAISLLLLTPLAVADEHTFAGPIFGMTTHDDEVLVADAGAGVVAFDAGVLELKVQLPGITDLSVNPEGGIWAITGGAPAPTQESGQGVHRVNGQGKSMKIANLFEFEATYDPDGMGVDSNPFDIHLLDKGGALVVDAGGNDLLLVDSKGDIQVVATFPLEFVSTDNLKGLVGCPKVPPELEALCGLPAAIPAESVPTSVTVGPDGYIYVGELKGFPAPVNESRIWRIAPNALGETCPSASCEIAFDGGFTSIIDLAFGPDGLLYVAELDEASWFAVEVTQSGVGGTINACDATSCVEVASGIPEITAIALKDDGTLLATEHALIPPLATVIEVP